MDKRKAVTVNVTAFFHKVEGLRNIMFLTKALAWLGLFILYKQNK